MPSPASKLSEIFSALSDPTRLEMVQRLAAGPMTVGDLSAPFPISKPAISRHLKVLEQAGLIRREIRGRHHWVFQVPEPLDEAATFLTRTRGFWDDKLGSLADFLENDDAS